MNVSERLGAPILSRVVTRDRRHLRDNVLPAAVQRGIIYDSRMEIGHDGLARKLEDRESLGSGWCSIQRRQICLKELYWSRFADNAVKMGT